MIRRSGGALFLLVAVACGSDSTSSSSGVITVEAGANQTAPVGTALQPYSVKVSNGSGPVAGLTVSWQVASGGGSVTPASSVTDEQGIAEAVATLGTQLGSQTVRASVSGYGAVVFTATGEAGPPTLLVKSGGDGQVGKVSQPLPQNLQVKVTDQYNNPVSGQSVSWALTSGGGTISAANNTTGLDGTASVVHAMGAAAGTTTVTATVTGLGTVTFDSKAIVPLSFSVLGGGNNVPDRTTSDLWVKDGFGYTGTWGGNGNAVFIWQLDGSGAPVLYDSIITPNIGTVSDIQGVGGRGVAGLHCRGWPRLGDLRL
jgi:adhesin/invasin